MIQKISAEDLKKMQDREGLVLQGCGGDLREWEDGIHQMLAEEKILQNGAHFKEIYAFEHEGCTNLLFMMDGIELDTGRLALWRLRTHAQFGGTWLSDYLRTGSVLKKTSRTGSRIVRSLARMEIYSTSWASRHARLQRMTRMMKQKRCAGASSSAAAMMRLWVSLGNM